jgi:hypothetical protein
MCLSVSIIYKGCSLKNEYVTLFDEKNIFNICNLLTYLTKLLSCYTIKYGQKLSIRTKFKVLIRSEDPNVKRSQNFSIT